MCGAREQVKLHGIIIIGIVSFVSLDEDVTALHDPAN